MHEQIAPMCRRAQIPSSNIKLDTQLHLRSLRRARFILGYAPDTNDQQHPAVETAHQNGISHEDNDKKPNSEPAAAGHSQRPMHMNCCGLLDLLSRRKGAVDDAAEAAVDPTRNVMSENKI